MAVLLSKESRVTFDGVLDYSFSNFHDCLSLGPEALDMLKLDCQEAFTCRSILNSDESYSSGSTYFIKSNYAPRCQLEQLALSIFQLHTKDAIFSAELSGAEWWTQVIDCRDDIGFHWDRDYGKLALYNLVVALCEAKGLELYILLLKCMRLKLASIARRILITKYFKTL